MPLPTLESLDSLLDGTTMTVLGDSLTYDGVAHKGFVDYGEQTRVGIGAIEQDMTVQIRRADIPVRPSASNRVVLARLPGETYQPAAVELDDSGNHWVFALKRVRL